MRGIRVSVSDVMVRVSGLGRPVNGVRVRDCIRKDALGDLLFLFVVLLRLLIFRLRLRVFSSSSLLLHFSLCSRDPRTLACFVKSLSLRIHGFAVGRSFD